jgi:hypothetical protein
MQSIGDILKDFKVEKKKGSERNDLMKQIYAFYDTEQEVVHTKRANWRKYISFLKENKLSDSKENQIKFKKSKLFIKKMSDKSMASFWLSHVKTPDLWFVLSVAKDKSFRNESVGAYIKGLQIK